MARRRKSLNVPSEPTPESVAEPVAEAQVVADPLPRPLRRVTKRETALTADDVAVIGGVITDSLVKALKPPEKTDEQRAAEVQRKVEARGMCPECRQPGFACKRKHVRMVVYPENPALARFFTGCGLNGVWYKSPAPGIAITVPADNDFTHIINRWDEEERILVTGRKASHNSGTLGPGGSTRAAHGGWR